MVTHKNRLWEVVIILTVVSRKKYSKWLLSNVTRNRPHLRVYSAFGKKGEKKKYFLRGEEKA